MRKLYFNIEDIFNINTAVIYNPDRFVKTNQVFIDSRKITGKAIYVALSGKKFDGHDFVREAIKAGASTIVINENKLDKFDDVEITIVTVKNTEKAFGELANCWRKKLNAKVVSITGSNGKTSTKDILSSILSSKFNVTKTISNNNNNIGVPLSILQANEKTEVLVLEHGTNHFGEIEYTAEIAEPDVALITNIGDSHLEFLIDKQGVWEEKEKLFSNTDKSGGLIVINNDDRFLRNSKRKYQNTFSYGYKSEPNLRGEISSYLPNGKIAISVNYNKELEEFILPLYGNSNAKNFLAAVAVSLKLGMTLNEIKKSITNIKLPDNRLGVTEFNNFILVNDTYNSNPESVIMALELLRKIKKVKRKIVIFGDMFELGKTSFEKHVSLHKAFTKCKITEVYTIGSMSKYLSLKLSELGIKTAHFRMKKSMSKFLNEIELNDAVILVKGSRGMEMEKFVEILKQRGEE